MIEALFISTLIGIAYLDHRADRSREASRRTRIIRRARFLDHDYHPRMQWHGDGDIEALQPTE